LKLRFRQASLCALLAGVMTTSAMGGPSGKDLYEEIIAATPPYDDPVLTAYIENLVDEIVAVSSKSGKKFTFTLVDSPGVNAFATRDNYVYANRGLLNYVQNEAQLVSVLAHEVAHITEGHVNEMENKVGGAQFLAQIAAMLAGSAEVYEASMDYANSLLKGRGRNNELEADATGARYMAKLGYDPDETIEMLAMMKDIESLQKARAREAGATMQTYHGIFSSHPRNDSRLRNVVNAAKSIDSASTRDNGEEKFRQLTEGLVWGENFKEKEIKPERYLNMQDRIHFDYPDGWKHQMDDSGLVVVGQPVAKDAALSMFSQPRTAQEPEEYLYNYLKVPQLREGKKIAPARLKGFTGILSGTEGKNDTRIAVIYYKMKAYLFTGEVQEIGKFRDFDEAFLESINTFRPVTSREIVGKTPQKIHYIQATSATTFESLAKSLKLKKREAEDLRMINGYYPSGEPKPGEWIRIFKR